ncbi:hypothetical protein BD780_002147 [Clostridium tetanomorphum]|uniref:Uncharacterized protein n=1 Tax=Clostridium tetanomorphum TaxID=1553 RepID=A0A923IZD3_CLOTT|nr:hypothetical protein [Clostridium tetanomorphum]KAJ51425.1 hypothetical protein CTM_12575 [Clostridium tetanomorphum DSM 665]MBC2396519.1 hypothetical protein [Clostridium tetanomorphum]MBP1863844.1 hypothetical protein [Clostridium tetanomorphum]NRS84922.1 hypothetical protein [Clostridium tetanomorphum]NRZ98138.1 uncharacterized protein YacL [Clostridium tetanomorphum]
MLVNSIFPKVNYPDDKKSIEHIIKEYDRRMEHILGYPNTKKVGKYILDIISILLIVYILKCSSVSFGIRILYMLPLIICIIYKNILLIKAQKDNYKNKKFYYGLKNFNIISICVFIFSGIFMIESLLFYRKWSDENYFISFCILAILSAISFIIARTIAPKKFIESYQYKENKLYITSSIFVGIVTLLVSIAYFSKPYYLILILSYVMVVVMSGLMTYTTFIYKQYDKIQELKKQINYIPKEK